MEIDLHMMMIILIVIQLMLTIAFYHQFKVHKAYQGVGWWLLSSISEVFVFGFILLRDIPSIIPVVVIIQDSMIIAGSVFLYIGVKKFFSQPLNLNLLIPVLSVCFAGLLFFLLIINDNQIRSGIIYITVAFFSFFTSYSLFANKSRNIKATENFNGTLFLVHGSVFLYCAFMIVTGAIVEDIVTPAFFRFLPYFDVLIVNLLSTFGFILIINQRLNAELSVEKEELRDSELQFRLMFENMSDGVALHEMVYDGNGNPVDYRIVDVNKAYEKYTDITVEKACGMLASELYGSVIPPYITEYNEVVCNREPFSFETYYEKMDKDFTISVISPKPGYFVTIFRDITLHKKLEADTNKLLVNSERSRAALLSILEDHMQAQKSLKESEEKYRFMFASNPQPMWIYDLETLAFLEINNAAINHYGYSKEEFLSMTLKDIRPEEDIGALLNDVKLTQETYNPGSEWRHLKKNGELINVEIQSHAITFNDRKSRHVMVNDITERKHAEEALKLALNELKNLQDNLDEAIFSFDPVHNRMLQVSVAHEAVFGYPPADFFKNPQLWYELIFPEDKPIIEAGYPVLNSGKNLQHQVRIVTADGKIRWIEAKLKPTLDKDAKLIQINGIVSDITDRKKAEAELRLQSAALNAAANSILISDNKGKIIWVNQAFMKMTGYQSEETIGKNTSELLKSGKQDAAFYKQLWDTILAGKTWNGEIINRRKDGTFYIEEQTITPLKDTLGNIYNFIAIKKDISKRKETEEKIHLLNEELEQRVLERTMQLESVNKELEAFSYSVSHDLRAPLRHISGYVDLLTDRFHEALPEKGKHYLDSIADSAHQMGELIDNLLQFSRSGRKEIQLTDLDMNIVLQEALLTVKQDATDRNIKWIIATLPHVHGDHNLLLLVWINLLSNAVKFTRGKKKARIETGFRDEKKEFVFFIRDNGAGFDMQYADKLFGVFQRLHSSEDFEGTGIGLANVRRIILKHGGRTWAEAEVDKGASFYFTLPKQENRSQKSEVSNLTI